MMYLTFIAPYVIMDVIAMFTFCSIAAFLLKRSAKYALNTSKNNRELKIATKNFHRINLLNGVILAAPFFTIIGNIYISKWGGLL